MGKSVGNSAMDKSLVVIFLYPLLTLTSAASWGYSDTNWDTNYPTCGGDRQSPVNIDSDDVFPADYSDFEFSLNYKILQKGTIENSGYSLKFTVDDSKPATISGGPLSNWTYTLHSFHLHWGSENGQGSEHTVDGNSYDAELHLVHYRSDYDNLTAAIADGQGNSLAVVGIFIQETMPWDQYHGVMDSETVNNLKMAANELSKPRRGPAALSTDMEVVLDQFTSAITDLNGLYHYEGSLTTPSCDEIVQWVVLDKPLHVRKNGLLAALRRNLDSNGDAIQDNYRPTQTLNGRFIYHHSSDSSSSLPASGCTNDNSSSSDGTQIDIEPLFTGKYAIMDTDEERWSLTDCFANGNSTKIRIGLEAGVTPPDKVTCNCVEQAAYLCNKAATPEFNDTIILSLSATECPFAWGYCMDLTSNQFGGDNYDHAVFTGPGDYWDAC